jgi:mRNA interferase RelE/StbE
VTWRVEFLPAAAEEDLPALPKAARGRVLSAIRKRLSLDPEGYGEPLRKELFGFWKLRVGDYRVIYRIDKGTITVLIVKVGMRRDAEVYKDMLARLKKSL